ncbi:MAG: site-specific integrase [Hyphomicrobiales bacterium]|nr:site-specific integrase [Hyphomicrobiales bacterium]
MTLTAKELAALPPGGVLRDGEVLGLHVRALQTRKSFYLYYRSSLGEERRPKIGDCSVLTVNEARRIAREMLSKVAAGQDPAGQRRAGKAGATVAELVGHYRETQLPKKKSARNIGLLLEGYILPELGSRKVAALDLDDAERLHARISRTAPIQANRVLATLSTLLTLAERLRLRPIGSNFCHLVERNPERPRRRYLVPGPEAKAIGEALGRRWRGSQHEAVLFTYLLLLTGARVSEIGQARGEWRRGDLLVLPEHKTSRTAGDKMVHLPRLAIELLDDPERGPHARPGYLVGVASPVKLWRAVRKEAGCPDLRLHDLRHTFASFGVAAEIALDTVGGLLGHARTQTTKRYAHLLNDPASAAVNRIAGGVAEAVHIEGVDR